MPIEIYSTDTDSGWISVIRKEGTRKYTMLHQVDVGNAPRGAVKFTTDGRGYVSNCGGDTISEIDVLTHREVSKIKVGAAPRGIGLVSGDRFAVVSNSGSNYLSVVDLNSRREIAQVAVGRDPRHMAITADGHWAYVAIWASHYIAKIDIQSLTDGRPERAASEVREVSRIPVGDGAHPYSLAIHNARREAYVANTQATYVSVIDLQSDSVVANIDVGSIGGRAVAFSPDGKYALLTIENRAEVAVIRMDTRAVVRRFPVGPGPRGIAIDPKDFSVYVPAFPRANPSSVGKLTFSLNTLTVLDFSATHDIEKAAPDEAMYAEIPVGKGPCSVSLLDVDSLSGVSKPKRQP